MDYAANHNQSEFRPHQITDTIWAYNEPGYGCAVKYLALEQLSPGYVPCSPIDMSPQWFDRATKTLQYNPDCTIKFR